MKSMSGSDFVKTLSSGEKKSDDLFIVGMAKLAEGDPNSILLGPTHKCGPWTKVPLSAVLRVVPLATCACRKHEHPVVAVYFKDKGDPLALALGQLLSNMQQELNSQLLKNSGGLSGSPRVMAMINDTGGPTLPGEQAHGDCVIIYTIVCWERDFSHDDPMPAARPGVYECVLVPIVICWPS
jgi:hypothetical protein